MSLSDLNILLLYLSVATCAHNLIGLFALKAPVRDPDTLEPAGVWVGFQGVMLVATVRGLRGAWVVETYSIESVIGVSLSLAWVIANGYLAVQLWRRRAAINKGTYPYITRGQAQ